MTAETAPSLDAALDVIAASQTELVARQAEVHEDLRERLQSVLDLINDPAVTRLFPGGTLPLHAMIGSSVSLMLSNMPVPPPAPPANLV